MNRRSLFSGMCGVAFAALATGVARADLRLYEGFDYATTASTTTTPEAAGDRSLSGVVGQAYNMGGYANPSTATNWIPINTGAVSASYTVNDLTDGTPSAGDVDIVSGNLTYPGLTASTGNSVSYGGLGYSPRLAFAPIPTPPNPSIPQGNPQPSYQFAGSAFYSALVRIDGVPGDPNGDPILSFAGLTTTSTSGGSAFFGGLFIKPNAATPDDATDFLVGVSKGQSVNGLFAVYDTTPYTIGSTLLVVGEWEFVPNVNSSTRESNDVARLYINPTSLGGTAAGSGATVVTDVGNFAEAGINDDLPEGSRELRAIAIHQRDATNPLATIDEIRVGTTFADVTPPSATMGDADFDMDGDVDGEDFLIWQRGLGGAATPANGNANGDGAVDGADLAIWRAQFGPGAPVLAAGAAIPEPATIGLALLSAIVMGYAARRRRS